MRTIEQAIKEIENTVSGRYMEVFPDSQLRKDTKENIELLKFHFETLAHAKKNRVKLGALECIMEIVFDQHPLPDTWQKDGMVNYFDYCRKQGVEHKLVKYPHDVKHAVEACDDIIARLEEQEKGQDTISVAELSKKYEKKWLYFNGDEDGCQWLYVKNIHRDGKTPVLCVDGVLLSYDGQDAKLTIRNVENRNFTYFYYFDADDDENYEGFTLCSSLDAALQSSPVDTSLPNHVIEPKVVVNDVLRIFAWEFEHGYDINVPGISELFKSALL